jgi:hypothetical protein
VRLAERPSAAELPRVSILAGVVSRVVVVAAVTLLSPRCDGTPSSAPDDPAAATLVDSSSRVYRTLTSGFTGPAELVVRDDAAWREAWSRIVGPIAPPPERPAVDFGREAIVIVAAGERPSGGWSVAVDSVAPAAGGALVVSYTLTGPGAGCVTAQMITSPADVVRVPRLSGEVRFTSRTVRTPC